MPNTLLYLLADSAPWASAVAAVRDERGDRDAKVIAFERVMTEGMWEPMAAAVLAGRHTFGPIRELRINRRSPTKKHLFILDPCDELLCRVVNDLLLPHAETVLSDACHSFRPRRSARTAFAHLRSDTGIGTRACLRLDVRNYFMSIPASRLLDTLPEFIRDDTATASLLCGLLTAPAYLNRGGVTITGVLPGTPLAPLLSNLYLRDVDAEMLTTGLNYARYSDDIIVLGDAAELTRVDTLLRGRLADLELGVNETKSGVVAAGEPWDFLGFRYHRGAVGVSANTARKFRARTRRLARRLDRVRRARAREAESITRAFVERMNRRLYGGVNSGGQFCWTTWFFPVITDSTTLKPLDESFQEQARFATTGDHRARNHRSVSHEHLRNTGHLPLVTAYHAWRDSSTRYRRLIQARVRGRSGPSGS